jgi:hypothetical protein
MRHLAALILLICFSCNQQGMTEEHRQKLKQEAADRKIQRHTDADILTAAKIMAVEVYELSKSKDILPDNMRWVSLQDTLSNSYEVQMQEAYQYSIDKGLTLYENIEASEDGEYIFTKPENLTDSTHGFWIIVLEQKAIIKSIR